MSQKIRRQKKLPIITLHESTKNTNSIKLNKQNTNIASPNKHKSEKRKVTRSDKLTIGKYFLIHWKVLKELYQMDKLATSFIILLSLVGFGTNFVELKMLEYATNEITDYSASENTGDFITISIYIGMFFIILFFMQITSNIYAKISEKYKSKVIYNVEKKIIHKLSEIPYEYYEANSFYEKINLASQASEQYSKGVYGVTEIVGILLMLIVYGIMLSKINLVFIGITFLSVIICFIIAGRVTDQQLDCWRLYVSPEKRKTRYFSNVFSDRMNHQNIQTTGSYSYFNDKFSHYIKKQRRSALKFSMLTISSELVTSLLFMITFFITVLIVGKGVVAGIYQIGYFSMVIMLLGKLFVTIKQFSWTMMNNNWYIKVLDSYYDILSIEGEHTKNQEEYANNKKTTDVAINKEKTASPENAIEINGLNYIYPQAEKSALNNISITFKKGEKIAVVGYNGSGKSTLISIILGLLKGYESSILLKEVISTAVLQDFGQYQLTIKENIEIGCGGKELSEERISVILKQVNLYDYVSSLPDGIYTKLGQLEKGVELSKGQWQRLAIGRMLANDDANVWILDEPTAYLDPLAEIEMYKFIFDLACDRLVFFISHRLGFAKNADRIIVVNDGTIEEDGTHSELMTKNGLYSSMYEAQKAWYG